LTLSRFFSSFRMSLLKFMQFFVAKDLAQMIVDYMGAIFTWDFAFGRLFCFNFYSSSSPAVRCFLCRVHISNTSLRNFFYDVRHVPYRHNQTLLAREERSRRMDLRFHDVCSNCVFWHVLPELHEHGLIDLSQAIAKDAKLFGATYSFENEFPNKLSVMLHRGRRRANPRQRIRLRKIRDHNMGHEQSSASDCRFCFTAPL
jgi:hypothetical protein